MIPKDSGGRHPIATSYIHKSRRTPHRQRQGNAWWGRENVMNVRKATSKTQSDIIISLPGTILVRICIIFTDCPWRLVIQRFDDIERNVSGIGNGGIPLWSHFQAGVRYDHMIIRKYFGHSMYNISQMQLSSEVVPWDTFEWHDWVQTTCDIVPVVTHAVRDCILEMGNPISRENITGISTMRKSHK